MKRAYAVAGQQGNLDGAKKLRPSQVRPGWIELSNPALKLVTRHRRQKRLQQTPAPDVELWLVEEALKERAQVQSSAANDERHAAGRK
jgi:hypothetical protein